MGAYVELTERAAMRALPQPRAIAPFAVERLAKVRRSQVEQLRHVLRFLPRGRWAPELGGLSVQSVALVEAAPARGVRVELRVSDRRLRLWLDARAAVSEARRVLGLPPEELRVARPLTLAEEGALELVLLVALGDGWRVESMDVRGVDAHADASEPSDWVALIVLLSDGTRTVATLELPDSFALLPPPPRGAELASGRLAGVPAQLAIEVGHTRLERAELRALAVRDVVLFGARARDVRGGPVRLRLGRGAFAARLDGQTLLVEDFFRLYDGHANDQDSKDTKGQSTMSEHNAAEGAATHTDQLLGELPVEIVCELGRVSMSGRDLVELKPGAVLAAGRPLSGPVDLTVGGRLVARGELVDVEGEIGVRVMQLID